MAFGMSLEQRKKARQQEGQKVVPTWVRQTPLIQGGKGGPALLGETCLLTRHSLPYLMSRDIKTTITIINNDYCLVDILYKYCSNHYLNKYGILLP